MNENPYKYLGPLDPVNDKLVCIPRTEDVNQVIDGVNKGDYWSILGPRQIGKTTFLRQIQNMMPGCYCLYFNLEISISEEKSFYRWLRDQMLDRIPAKPKETYITDWDDNHPNYSFIHFLEIFRAEDHGKKILFLFDEIDSLPFLDNFLHTWQKMFHDRYNKEELNRYAIAVTGEVDLIAKSMGPTSPFNIAGKLYLGDFSDGESEILIDLPFRKLGINIEPRAKKLVISQIAGHPQMLQQTCSQLVDIALKEKRSISVKDVEIAINSLLKNSTTIDLLKNELKENKELQQLIRDIVNGVRRKYFLNQEFSISGAGAIVEDRKSFCKIRNKVFERLLKDSLDQFDTGDISIPLIKKSSKKTFFDETKKQPLPYALKQLRVKNYYGIKETAVENIPLDTQCIFLTGENGFGKTVLLQALTIGLFGERDVNTILTGDQKGCKIGVEIYEIGKNTINNLGEPDFKQFKNFAAYGSARLEIQSRQTQNEISEKSSKTYGLFNSDGVLLNIEYELSNWHYRKNPRFDTVKRTLIKLMPNMAEININEDGEIVYIEKESGNGKNYEPLPFSKLASGHKSIIAMVGDILIRLYKQHPEIMQTEDLSGIVIIDELDLHLHPKWQRKLPILFSEVFPKVQFIISTHSVIPFLGAPENSVFLKVTRDEDSGIQTERIDIDIHNLLPNSILTSAIFDLEGEEITQVNKKSLNDVRTEDTYEEKIENDKIKEKLIAFEKSDKEFPDDIFEKEESDEK